MPRPPPVMIGNAMLYAFSTVKSGKLVRVVRITDSTSERQSLRCGRRLSSTPLKVSRLRGFNSLRV